MLEWIGAVVLLLLAGYGVVSAIEDMKSWFYRSKDERERPVLLAGADEDTVEFVARRVRAISERDGVNGAVVVQKDSEKEMTGELSDVRVMTPEELNGYLREKLRLEVSAFGDAGGERHGD